MSEIISEQQPLPELTAIQKQRYAHLKRVYGNDTTAMTLVRLLDGKANSWKKVTDKLDLLDKADYKQQLYHDALYDIFALGEMYTSDDIIGNVGEVRSDLRLGTYLAGLKKNCEADFFNLFIVETVTTEICCDGNEGDAPKMKKIIVGYKPLFKLKPEN